jgi:hypothetical protein
MRVNCRKETEPVGCQTTTLVQGDGEQGNQKPPSHKPPTYSRRRTHQYDLLALRVPSIAIRTLDGYLCTE